MRNRQTRRRGTAEDHLEEQRQQFDRSSLNLDQPENMLYPHTGQVDHIPVELHQDIANWFRRLGDGVKPSAHYTPAQPDSRPLAVVVDRDIVEWFRAHGDDADAQINVVLREFMRSVESASGQTPE